MTYYDLWWFMYIYIYYQFYLHILYSRHLSSNLFLFDWWVPKFQEQITTTNIESSENHLKPPQPVQSNRPTVQPVETGDCVLGARIPHTQPIIHASSMVPKDSRWILIGGHFFLGDFCIQNLIDQHLRWAFGNVWLRPVESCLRGSQGHPLHSNENPLTIPSGTQGSSSH